MVIPKQGRKPRVKQESQDMSVFQPLCFLTMDLDLRGLPAIKIMTPAWRECHGLVANLRGCHGLGWMLVALDLLKSELNTYLARAGLESHGCNSCKKGG